MAAPVWPQSRTVVLDNNGIVASGARAYFFEDGTTTPRSVYQDSSLSTPHANPLAADSNGRWPRIYLKYGAYSERITTAVGSQLWTPE